MSKGYLNVSDGAGIFYKDNLAFVKYNAKLHIAGDSVKVRFYERPVGAGYRKNKGDQVKGKHKKIDSIERFRKSGRNARKKLYNYVACNLKQWKCFRNKKHTVKVMTLTFRNDVKDRKKANNEFKNGIKRLNYTFGADEAFLKYVAVPELQKNKDYGNRYVWHYHVIFFNMPYIPVNYKRVLKDIEAGRLPKDYDKGRNVEAIWGNGFVYLEKLKNKRIDGQPDNERRDQYDLAGYMAKYVGKGLEGDYNYCLTNKLLYSKRFLHSDGLLKPSTYVAFFSRKQRDTVFQEWGKKAKHFKIGGRIAKRFESFKVENEFCGLVFGMDFRCSIKKIKDLIRYYDDYAYGFN